MSNLQHHNTSPRVLMVDDSPLMRRAASKMLGGEFDVVVAENGEEGWDTIQSDPTIQVVFTDLNMPVLDGFGLIERVRRCENDDIRQLPLVVVTGADNDEEAKERVLSIGATDFITKPFNATSLKARAHAYAKYQHTTQVLQQRSTLDLLTGLLNAQAISDQLAKDISFASRHREDLAVMTVGLDDFPALLKRVGQAGAETIIKHVADVLSGAVRREDSLSRPSISQFIVSLPMAKSDGAVELAKRVCKKIAAFNVTMAGETLQISASVGVCNIEKGSHPEVDKVIAAVTETFEKAANLSRGQVQSIVLGEAESTSGRFISIDRLLAQLESGEQRDVRSQLDDALQRLEPLLELLSAEQRLNLLNTVDSPAE